MSPRFRTISHYIGSILAVAGLVFVVFRLKSYWGQLDFSKFDAKFWLVITVGVLEYSIANSLLALAWRNILVHLGEDLSTVCALRIYGISQLAKYVPGNVMHLAGRQAMGQAQGIPGWPLAKSTVWELSLLSFTGFLFTPLILQRFFSFVRLPEACILFVGVVCLAAIMIKKLFGVLLVKAFAQHFFFLLQSGLVFFCLLLHFLDDTHISFLNIFFYCGSFIVAWLIGLITPGAPAGLGVREFVLMALLNNSVAETDLLLTVLLSRIVTVIGEVLFFSLVYLFVPKTNSGLMTRDEHLESD